MNLFDLARSALGLAAGSLIGYAFGLLQAAARRRHVQQERDGKLKNGWSLMPGSGARVAYLLVALALVQVVCPLIFVEGTQWFVSGGVVIGYGWTLYRELRRRIVAARG